MIHEIARELGARLNAVGVPLPVVDGPEPTRTNTWGRERIVIEHDPNGGDAFIRPRSQSLNPKRRYNRSVSYKATIYAQSPASGASVFEHRIRAERVLDAVLCAMDEVVAARDNTWQPKGGGFIVPDELEGNERPNGAVYELKFVVDRGVAVRTWAGAIRPEFTVGAGGMLSRTKVSQAGSAESDISVPNDAETACGD